MSSLAVLGSSFGDEAKAKIVDVLAQDYEIIVRFQGGSNAGHTIKSDNKTHILHLVPSGILYENKTCLLGAGVVIDPFGLKEEIENLIKKGIKFEGRFFIDERAFLVLPIHKELDAKSEKKSEEIGTTKRGIGPTYSDAIARFGIRFIDLFDDDYLDERLKNLYSHHSIELPENLINELQEVRAFLGDYKINGTYFLNEKYAEGKKIIFEGAQGTLLDVFFGTYPFVTSSHTVAGGISSGLGFAPKKIEKTIGVFKSYFTRVGKGPFPTELFDETGEKIRQQGHEFGSTTGRPRRCGWFDAVAAKYSVMLNGFDEAALTLLDVLSGFDKIKICTSYQIDGQESRYFPSSSNVYGKIVPNYIEVSGWSEDISGIDSFDDLPENAKNYVLKIEELLGIPITIVSVGPDRKQTIFR